MTRTQQGSHGMQQALARAMLGKYRNRHRKEWIKAFGRLQVICTLPSTCWETRKPCQCATHVHVSCSTEIDPETNHRTACPHLHSASCILSAIPKCTPDRLMPRSPSSVASPPGSSRMSCSSAHADSTWVKEAAGTLMEMWKYSTASSGTQVTETGISL